MNNKKRMEDKLIKDACEKNGAKPVNNLLVFLLVIDGDTGKILDVVRKPGFGNDNLTGFPQSNIDEGAAVKLLVEKGYLVRTPKI